MAMLLRAFLMHLLAICCGLLAFRSAGSDSEGGSSGSEDDEPGSDEEGLTALERRRRQRAAGDHPLQEQFRKAAAKLLRKHGVEGGGAWGCVEWRGHEVVGHVSAKRLRSFC